MLTFHVSLIQLKVFHLVQLLELELVTLLYIHIKFLEMESVQPLFLLSKFSYKNMDSKQVKSFYIQMVMEHH